MRSATQSVVSNDESSLEDKDSVDTFYNMFLCGELSLSTNLLKLIQLPILQHIFSSLPIVGSEHNRVKLVLMLMMIEKCKIRGVEAQTGVSFFQRALEARDPRIA
jgi:hypothetical protein